ncbi:MAG: DNA modification methylase [Treponema sp.]|nr:DNA modification methylase [Treponema sp.]
MKIEKTDISKLNPAEYNPRKDLQPGDAEYEKLKRSIEQFGYVEPIIWNKTTGRVIGGHQRLNILVDMGLNEVDCVVVEMDKEREKALNIALNKINGEWDNDKLAMLISDLQGSDFDVSLTGFEEAEIADLFEKVGEREAKDDDFDMTAALEKASFVERGDIWTVGRHRLMCGDATSSEDVSILMDGKRANLIVTDPPYGISVKSANGLTIQNDSMKNDEFYNLLLSSFKCMADNLEKGGAAYVFHADTEGINFRRAFIDAGFHLAGVCIWAKNHIALGRSDYQWKHEPILYGYLQNGKHPWYAGRNQTTIWNYNKPQRNAIHPTMKPLDLLSYPICNSSQENAIILDTFGGSGSTMMACEQTNRICHMMEIDEKYASVILRRAAENGIAPGDIYVIRDGVRIPYAELVKEVETTAS